MAASRAAMAASRAAMAMAATKCVGRLIAVCREWGVLGCFGEAFGEERSEQMSDDVPVRKMR